MTYIFFLGRERQLSLAELRAALRIASQPEAEDAGAIATLETDTALPENFIDRLGGTDRIAMQIGEFTRVPSPTEILSAIAADLPKKWKVGVSTFVQSEPVDIARLANELKKAARDQNSRLAFITPSSNRTQLNAAQVMFNKLDQPPNMELTLLELGGDIVLLKTIQIQDIVAYEKRDTARPARDPKSGMLPPKLAQIMINIAIEGAPSGGENIRILDPFCGSGTVLQEGWLMDYKMFGSDVSEQATKASQKNLAWLTEHFTMDTALQPEISQHDTQNSFPDTWKNSFSAVVTEPYLGPPVKAPLSPALAEERMQDLAAIYRAAFKHVHPLLMPAGVIAFLFPIFFTKDGWFGMPQNVIDGIQKGGYRVVQLDGTARGSLTYKRPDALVARELFVFRKT